VVVQNLLKHQSPKLLWFVDLKGEHGPSIGKGTCGGWRFTLLESHFERLCLRKN
jgi:hypothetical protein